MDNCASNSSKNGFIKDILTNDLNVTHCKASGSMVKNIEKLNINVLNQQKRVLENLNKKIDTFGICINPFMDYETSGNSEDIEKGKQLVYEGKVGCILVAGGQGTRLNFAGPKGLFAVSLIKKKSLFQLFAEKVVAASKQANKLLQVAILTSPLNHEAICSYFATNNYFGLESTQIDFFEQDMLPFLNDEGNIFLDGIDSIAQGPDGNGYSLFKFCESGIANKWGKKGITTVNFVVVDNPLADPFDAELVGFHERKQSEITVKCTLRQNENENVGLLVRKNNGQVGVIEYSEMPPQENSARCENGQLKHCCANLSLFCFSLKFIKKSYEDMKSGLIEMPLHAAYKIANYLNSMGEVIKPTKPNAWKFERYIFDLLAFSNHVNALLYTRHACFSPLKNASGQDSLETVQKSLLSADRKQLKIITGNDSSDLILELSPEFYYPTPELLTKWKGKKIHQGGYIQP